jgi:hypothetical protein
MSGELVTVNCEHVNLVIVNINKFFGYIIIIMSMKTTKTTRFPNQNENKGNPNSKFRS